MKKTFLSIALISLTLVGCQKEPTPPPVDESKVQVILDNTFQNGITVDPSNGSRQDDGWTPDDKWLKSVDLKWGNEDKPISWLAAQHGDIYSLNDKYNKFVGGQPEVKDGYYTFKDESKEISVNPGKGSIYLELNASKEYIRPRQQKEQWCHLLLQQGFTNNVLLSEVESVDFTMNITMKKFIDHMGASADRNVHATQFLMYLVIRSQAAADASDFFWFGIPFFDNRYPNGLPESGLIDAGGAGATSKFIYGMPSSDYLPKGLPMNEEQVINVDIKPYIGRALLKARDMGYFLASTLDDLTFQSMNIGFEIPGTYDCGIEFYNFGLTANYKK